MKKFLWIILLAVLPNWTTPARAQSSERKQKVDPVQRVSELMVTVKTDKDERKRARAAEQLGAFDGKLFPEIVPILADVAETDAKQSVRLDAVSSLAGIRPISATAGMALEKAAASDASWKVRWHAKTALVKYRFAGYSQAKFEPKATKQTEPINSAAVLSPPPQANSPPVRKLTSPALFPVANSKTEAPSALPRPLPPGLPQGQPVSQPAPAAPSADDRG